MKQPDKEEIAAIKELAIDLGVSEQEIATQLGYKLDAPDYKPTTGLAVMKPLDAISQLSMGISACAMDRGFSGRVWSYGEMGSGDIIFEIDGCPESVRVSRFELVREDWAGIATKIKGHLARFNPKPRNACAPA